MVCECIRAGEVERVCAPEESVCVRISLHVCACSPARPSPEVLLCCTPHFILQALSVVVESLLKLLEEGEYLDAHMKVGVAQCCAVSPTRHDVQTFSMSHSILARQINATCHGGTVTGA